jgi:hypothetical protein|tara:strand:+ start:176 stop:799 length:624 start_codon:yes stop_codon:yes gene_type:complete
MSTFKDYLTESTKSYDYKVKVAGDISDDFASRMETALQKFEVAKLSSGKKTPIMTLPLDFPALSNESVTIFDVTTNYPVAPSVMKEYLADYMNMNSSLIVVRKPGEPTEEYQADMQIGQKSEYANKLLDVEMKDAPKVKAEEFFGDKYNMSLMRELLKSKKDKDQVPAMPDEDNKNKAEKKLQDREEKGTPSPLSKATNKHPDPKRK